MLKRLRKYFSSDEDNAATAETLEELSQMTKEDQAALEAQVSTTAELTAQLATVTEANQELQDKFAELQTQFAEITAHLEQAKAALETVEAEKAALVADAKAKVMAARIATLSNLMGDEKGAIMAASLEVLSDEAFATVVSGYAASFEAEEKSEMFQESGVAAEVPPVAQVDPVKALEASIAAKFKTTNT